MAQRRWFNILLYNSAGDLVQELVDVSDERLAFEIQQLNIEDRTFSRIEIWEWSAYLNEFREK
ncbi:MAG: hypothetical protein ACK4S4_15640 [Pyrinomonadaceae bacterium]